MANPTETVESVLAEMRDGGWVLGATQARLRNWAARLAAAHERDMALLREARNWIDNDTDEVAAVIARIDAHLSGAGRP